MSKPYKPFIASIAACTLFLYTGCMPQTDAWNKQSEPSPLERLLGKEEPKRIHEALLEPIAEALLYRFIDSFTENESDSLTSPPYEVVHEKKRNELYYTFTE